MTCPDTYSDEALRALVAEKLTEDPSFMPQMLAEKLNVPLRRVIEALPTAMRSRAPGLDFIAIWEAMTEWEKVTFMTQTPGAILEIVCRLPKGKSAHGMYNLMDKTNPLCGHLFATRIDSIWFVSKQLFGLESHSVQFFDAQGHQCFSVYLGRDEKRQIIPSVRDGFTALKAKHGCTCSCKNGTCCNSRTAASEGEQA